MCEWNGGAAAEYYLPCQCNKVVMMSQLLRNVPCSQPSLYTFISAGCSISCRRRAEQLLILPCALSASAALCCNPCHTDCMLSIPSMSGRW